VVYAHVRLDLDALDLDAHSTPRHLGTHGARPCTTLDRPRRTLEVVAGNLQTAGRAIAKGAAFFSPSAG
jgi:hypothetical protein